MACISMHGLHSGASECADVARDDSLGELLCVLMAAPPTVTDFAEIQGQEHAICALEVTAAGGRNLRKIIPPQLLHPEWVRGHYLF